MKKRIQLFTLFTFLVFASQGCIGTLTGENGNGNLVSEERNIEGFHQLKCSGGFDVELIKSTNKTIKVITDENLLDNVETYVRAGTLHVKSRNIGNASELSLKIHYENLDKISSSGAVEIHSDDVMEAENLDIKSSGASEINLSLDVRKIDLNYSGASKTSLSGKAEDFVYKGSGASKLKAYDLEADHAKIKLSGAGSARIFARKSLSASVSGAGNVYYKGNPEKLQTNMSGAGNIRSK